ncbi:ARD-domain-containing protein [Sodiomyces alkalinus F11]|uniref:Acireductone dioxygenase n=1 Tax=Sodiomyces alkalinus (strain CBS 110278 / VKM F-3762 / F11) TaxID=1314773 RepID=A0A3N2Q082_SODAK|nr:ARD-domain-containing protein [Sodiomyces alkalinus F11]ROT40150.1 ARD-domain-containing protein [Sodiomyces alkalinus F11]
MHTPIPRTNSSRPSPTNLTRLGNPLCTQAYQRLVTKRYFSFEMRAYWFDNLPGDQRMPHDSGRAIDTKRLEQLGVIYYNIPDTTRVDQLASERGYKNRDEIVISPESMAEKYEEKIKMFFREHLHEDEEIRYIRDGRGYFDVRSRDDEWVRIQVDKNDLLILPAGIYHRFTTDNSNYIKAMRLFKDEPKWTPLNRSAALDINSYRQLYIQQYLSDKAAKVSSNI